GRALDDRASFRDEARIVRADGAIRTLASRGEAVVDAAGNATRIVGVGQDITERKDVERRLDVQHAAVRVLAAAETEAEAVTDLMGSVCRALEWRLGAVWILDEPADVLRCIGTWRANQTEPSAFEDATRARTFQRGVGLPGRVWASGEAAWVEDVNAETDFLRASAAEREGLHGAFGFPIRMQSQVIGVMEFFSSRLERLDPDLLETMAMIGLQLGHFIERGRTREAQRTAEVRLREQRDDLQKLTQELGAANKELESFGYTISHDLKAHVRAIALMGQVLKEDEAASLGAHGKATIERLLTEAARMSQLISDLLELSRTTAGELHRERVDLSALALEVMADLRAGEPSRTVEARIGEGIVAEGDARLLKVVFENLLGNAWKYTSKTLSPRVEFGRATLPDGSVAYFTRDSGAGFEPTKAELLFQPFRRMHGKDFPGTGIGLATVRRIIERHGGRVWAKSSGPGNGAEFWFTLG
ncbi:MAG: ATP-binding protein, partial [Candidatus Thermoplasmatota archaeon]